MKRLFVKIFPFLFVICSLLCGTYFSCLSNSVAFAETESFSSEIVEDENISISLTATNRQNGSLSFSKQEVVHQNETYQYLFFKWRNLQSLNFHISKKTDGKQILEDNFSATYVRSDLSVQENIDHPVEFGTSTQILPISEKLVSDAEPLSVTFLTDRSQISTENSRNGFGFGVYKFDFSYNFLDEQQNLAIPSFLTCVVAVVPDDIDQAIRTAKESGVSLIHEVVLPQGLVNVYDISFSSSVFDYVNPDRIRWQATGRDTQNQDYVLYKQMQQDPQYNNYKWIYDTETNTTGTPFRFSTLNIEGKWTVTCEIVGNEENNFSLKSPEISTVKVEKPSLWWVWLLIGMVVLLLIVTVGLSLFFWNKKREKMW